MFVREMEHAWQIVLQPDHGELSGQLAAQWGGGAVEAPRPYGSVQVAARRHDDGWAVWEREPTLNPGTARPTGFLEVAVPSHLTFYRACIAAVTEQDPYAGLLVSMHGSGIYTGRYGTQPGLGLKQAAEHPELVNGFVAEQEAWQERQVAELGVPEAERWVNYKLLQVYDRLAVYFSLQDIEGGTSETLAPLPLGYGGDEGELLIEPIAPWHVRMSPFPFVEAPGRFSLVRRVVPKREWASNDEFRSDFFATAPERVQITVDR